MFPRARRSAVDDRDDFGRAYYRVDRLGERGDSAVPDDAKEHRERATVRNGANVVGSQLARDANVLYGGTHAPALDIDLPCRLVESTTPGHFHLFIDHEMPWSAYMKLLYALQDAGILEPGYVASAVNRGQSFLRLPHVKKQLMSGSSYLGESEYAL
jgi:hypothetical protein